MEFAARRRVRINGTLTCRDGEGLTVEVEQAYGNCPQYIQPRTLLPAGNDRQVLQQPRHDTALTDRDAAQIRAADTFFLGTTHPDRGNDASHRGGPAGFVRVEGEQVRWPDYAGNNMFNSFGNLVVDPAAALLFISFDTGRILQLSGTAAIEWDHPGEPGDDSHTGRRARFHTQRVVSGHLAAARHHEGNPMTDPSTDNYNGATRVEYLLGAPLAENAVRQWPQMREIARGRQLIADVEGNFPELTLEVGRRHQLGDTIVVEWTCNYGDGRLYRNVTIGELVNGEVTKVTDYWGEPVEPPEWRRAMTAKLDMPADGIWKDDTHLARH